MGVESWCRLIGPVRVRRGSRRVCPLPPGAGQRKLGACDAGSGLQRVSESVSHQSGSGTSTGLASSRMDTSISSARSSSANEASDSPPPMPPLTAAVTVALPGADWTATRLTSANVEVRRVTRIKLRAESTDPEWGRKRTMCRDNRGAPESPVSSGGVEGNVTAQRDAPRSQLEQQSGIPSIPKKSDFWRFPRVVPRSSVPRPNGLRGRELTPGRPIHAG